VENNKKNNNGRIIAFFTRITFTSIAHTCPDGVTGGLSIVRQYSPLELHKYRSGSQRKQTAGNSAGCFAIPAAGNLRRSRQAQPMQAQAVQPKKLLRYSSFHLFFLNFFAKFSHCFQSVFVRLLHCFCCVNALFLLSASALLGKAALQGNTIHCPICLYFPPNTSRPLRMNTPSFSTEPTCSQAVTNPGYLFASLESNTVGTAVML